VTTSRGTLPEERPQAGDGAALPLSDSYNALIEVATQLFGEVGYERTTVREIAKRMGVQSGSLYSHISSKNEILEQIVQRIGTEFIARAREAIEEGGDAQDQLRRFVVAHLTVLHTYQAGVSVYFNEWKKLDAESQKSIVKLRRHYEELLAGIVERGMAAGELRPVDVKSAVLVIISTVNWTYQWYRPDGPRTPAELADDFLDIILRGLQA
jgi:TetR/AcrR family transcriptional regulator, cholesterol catabolism regulator